MGGRERGRERRKRAKHTHREKGREGEGSREGEEGDEDKQREREAETGNHRATHGVGQIIVEVFVGTEACCSWDLHIRASLVAPRGISVSNVGSRCPGKSNATSGVISVAAPWVGTTLLVIHRLLCGQPWDRLVPNIKRTLCTSMSNKDSTILDVGWLHNKANGN